MRKTYQKVISAEHVSDELKKETHSRTSRTLHAITNLQWSKYTVIRKATLYNYLCPNNIRTSTQTAMSNLRENLYRWIRSPWVLPILVQFLFLLISYMNIHPFGFIRGGGDAVQVFNFQKFSDFSNYTWINEGEGYAANFFAYGIEYGIIGFFSRLLSLSVSQQSFFYYALFLSGSFWSFFIGLHIFDKHRRLSLISASGLSVSYALSSYTLYAFDSGWAFTPYLNLYFLIPIFFSAVYAFFTASRITFGTTLFFAFSILLLLMGMQNLAFLVALEIFTLLFVLSLIFFRFIRLDHLIITKGLLYSILTFFLLSPLILPQIGNLIVAVDTIVNTNKAGLNDWIAWQSIPFSSLFFYLFSFDFFARQNAIPILFSVVYFGLALVSLRVPKNNKLPLLFFVMLFFSFLILNKGKGIIPPEVTSLLFGNAVMGALRSYDKALLFVPYFSLMVFALAYRELKYARFYLILLVGLSILFNRHLFTGNLVTRHALSYKPGENYLTTNYSPIIRLPEEFYRFANTVNSEGVYSKLLQTPYTVVSSVGWMNLPGLRYIGLDPITQLFNQPSINMASFRAFSDAGNSWNYGAIWNTGKPPSSDWLIRLSSMMNVQYVMYRKETEPFIIKQTRSKIQRYQTQRELLPVFNSRFFDAFKINPTLFTPVIYAPRHILTTHAPLRAMPTLLQKNTEVDGVLFTTQNTLQAKSLTSSGVITTTNPPVLEFKKIHPTKYVVRVHHATAPFMMVFSDTYHVDWRAIALPYISDQHLDRTARRLRDNVKLQDDWEATPAEIRSFIRTGIVTSIGDMYVTPRESLSWNNSLPSTRKMFNSPLRYVSKNIHGSIQNENLPDQHSAEDNIPLDKHLKINGYANAWLVDPTSLCKKSICAQSKKGADFEIIIEFRQQRLFEATMVLFAGANILILFGSVLYLAKKRME